MHQKKTQDGLMRHPRDSEAWKIFDLLHPEFANDPQNVRFGLATDGFNPFGNMSTSHSTFFLLILLFFKTYRKLRLVGTLGELKCGRSL